jgi:hypothetical protein
MKQKIICETTVNTEGYSLKITAVYMTSSQTLLACCTLTEPPAGFYPRNITTLKDEIEVDTGINETLPVTIVANGDVRLTEPYLICLYRANTASLRDENRSHSFFGQQSNLKNDIEKTRLEAEQASTRLKKLEAQYKNNALFAARNSILADEKEEQAQEEQAIWNALVRLGVTKKW